MADARYSVKAFGAVGDGRADDTAAVQSALNAGMAVGARIWFPPGTYKITDTLRLANQNYYKSFGVYGESGNSTRIYFHNDSSLKDMFNVDSDVNYLEVSDLEFIDLTPRTSRCFYFVDTSASSMPAWKHLFRNVRICGFKEGVRFDGGVAATDDTHCSEVMFLHSKLRNCETGLVYNNVQAVNHQLIGLDLENDTEGEEDEWVHIKMERGTTLNHIGGSVIGKGPYLQYKFSVANGFPQTCQFASKGVRVEKRGGASPLIDHDTSSTVTLSNVMRITIADMAVNAQGGADLFARFGGKTFAKLTNVNSSQPMDVEAYMTANLSANGLYGSIVMEHCNGLTYKRVSDVAAYGSAGVAGSNLRSIPADISIRGEGAQGQADGDGFFAVNAPAQTVYGGGWAVAGLKTLVYVNADTGGFGSGSNPATALVNLPRWGRPCRFRLLRDDVNAGSAFEISLVFVVGDTDYTVATITPTSGVGGHFEAPIQTASGLTNFINDGVGWDGKMKVIKSGTVNGFVGLIMIDYM